MSSFRPMIGLVLLLFAAMPCAAATVTFNSALDRWMYPFAFSGGARDLAPTFGAVGTSGFDNRDGQFLIGFDTAGGIPTGQGADNYRINSATVRAAVGAPSGFEYDPTYDSFRTYLPATDVAFLADADPGRPIELHGLGFRNGYTQLSFGPNDAQPPGFEETSSFGPPGSGTRNVFPLGFLTPGAGQDMSNNVSQESDSNPWAIGMTSLAAGLAVPTNTVFSFSLDLANPDVLSYLQQGLNSGTLGFAVTSLHAASQTGGPPVPQFITKENTLGATLAPVLEIDYQIVPEPGALSLVAAGTIAVLGIWGLRRSLAKAA